MSVGRTDGVAAGQLHTVTVLKDDKGYGMTVSGNDPVVVQSVVKGGAAWRVGVRTGDRLLAVNNTSVETSEHTQVVQLIRSSPTVVLRLQRHSTITAPLPVGREKQRQVELTNVQTIHLMLENEIRYIETLRSTLARGGSDRKMSELEAAEGRRAKLQQQIDLLLQTSPGSPRHSDHGCQLDWTSAGVPQQRQGFLSHLPRSLSNLTGQSIRSIRNSVNHVQASPVTCLDGGAGGAPPPLPPRCPPHPPPPPPPPSSQGVPLRAQHRHHHTAPNSIAVQMAYPLVAVTPPLIQNAVPGHHRSKSSPEELNLLNNSNEDKEWEMVTTPPGTPPPPYPSPPPPQIAIDPQRAIISMEEDDSPTLSRSMFSSGGFSCVESLSVARLAVFLNWVAGERRPAQALLLYLLADTYSTGQAAGLARWAYELHSAFLVPGAPLALSSVDENMAREIDDALINEHDKEDVLRRIFFKVREKAKEELAQQLTEFQIKRQLGLATFYGPTDAVLDQCDLDKTQETAVVMNWLVPRLAIWADTSSGDHWSATYGSPAQALLAAAIPPLLQHTFCLKPQMISSVISPGPPGSPPRPAFLQRDKLFKQRMKHINKSTNHPLVIRGHHLSPIMVTSVCHCHQCHLLIWGIAPQAYNCSDCKLRVHRSCARQVEEPCCGPTAAPTRISRLMEKLTTAPIQPQPIGNAYQHEASNHQHHHHHHEKKPKKSSTSSHFLNMERNSRRTEDDSMALDNSATSHNTSDTVQEQDKTEAAIPEIIIQETVDNGENQDDFTQKELQSVAIVLTDSECAPDKKKNKIKHRKTMSMSSTLELVKSLGDEWIEAAKRELEEHSNKKKELIKKKEKEHLGDSQKKDKDHHHIFDLHHKKDKEHHPVVDKHHEKQETDKSDKRKSNDMVTLILYDASVGETDDFEVLEECEPISKKSQKKKSYKESKDDTKPRKISAVNMINAQKNTVKKIAKAGSVSAFNFIRSKKKPLAILGSSSEMSNSSLDHAILATELLLEHERIHTNTVHDPRVNYLKKLDKESEDESKSNSSHDEEIYYDAKSAIVDEPVDELPQSDEPKIGLRSLRGRRTIGSSLKRTNGGRRRPKKRNSADEAPPLPPRAPLTNSAPPVLVRQANVPQKHSHWLFGSSFKGESKRDDDNGADTVSQMTDSSHFSSEHSADRTENNSQLRGGPSVAARPVTRAESYRDRADRVKRTKRKTSDPNQLTSSKDYNDAEVVAGAASGPGAPSGGSSNSSLSSKSNDSSHPDNHGGSQSDWSEEEDCGGPWSSRAPPELIASMSGVARKRQDLIHELIWSESSHVRWLRVLRRVYHHPLQRAGATLLPPQELRALLPNLPDVLQRHRRLAQELRTLQQNAKVPTGPVADALISMLGEGRYASALARFCGGQGLALDALKERRKRNKELNLFLARSEQDPLCARLRLQDLLACVWQRLTKYQLLLEGIMKTAHALDDESPGPEGTASNLEDFAKVSHALELAKDVLNTVNTAIKTMENEYRLKTIQSKLEIRGAGGTEATEAGNELRRLDLARHSLIMEGSLSIRQDSNKRVNVLALLLKECLVLLHTDGERYILRPIPQATHQPLSPVIQWSAVFFRPNAAVKNCFFLVNINSTQMYELSTSSTTEYNTWTKRLLDAATALEPKPGVTEEGTTQPIPPTQNTTATAEAVPNGAPEPEPTNEEEPTPPKPTESEDDGNQVNGALATVVSEEEAGISGPPHKMDTSLLEPAILTITQPPVTQLATVEITPEERLRRAEEKVSLAMAEAVEAAQDVSGSSAVVRSAAQSIVADQMAQDSTEKLLLSAQDHVNKLTEVLLRALRESNSSGCAMTKCSIYTDHGLCDTCTARQSLFSHSSHGHPDGTMADSKMAVDGNKMAAEGSKMAADKTVPNDGNSGFNADGARDENLDSIVLFEEVGESSTDPNNDSDALLVKSSGSGLRGIITELLTRLPELERDRQILRGRLQQAENRIHLLHQLHKECNHSEESGKQEACGEVAIPNSAELGSGDG